MQQAELTPWRSARTSRWWRRAALAGAGALVLPAVLVAQPPAASFGPGFADPQKLGLKLDDEALSVEVNLQGPLIQFVAEAAKAADPELARALAKIRSVLFRLYRTEPAERPALAGALGRTAARLEALGWQRAVWVRKEATQTYLLLQTDGTRISGLVALFLDADQQLGFINIAGEVDPAQIGRIAQRFDIGDLGDVSSELGAGGEAAPAPPVKPPGE